MVGQPPMYRVLATRFARVTTLVALAIIFLASFPAAAQQTYVTSTMYTVAMRFSTAPKSACSKMVLHTQIGFRPKPWVSVGFDYTITAGDLTITPDQLLPLHCSSSLAHGIARRIAARCDSRELPVQHLSVPAHSVTQSFAVGPQFAYRHFSKATFFIRPSVGAIREGATPKPRDPMVKAIVAQLAPRRA